MILRAGADTETCVTRMPVWKLCCVTICAKFRSCLIPIVVSELNSTQIVPMEGPAGFGFEAVGGVVYFSSMAVVGRAEKVIFLRLQKEGMLDLGLVTQGEWRTTESETGGI